MSNCIPVLPCPPVDAVGTPLAATSLRSFRPLCTSLAGVYSSHTVHVGSLAHAFCRRYKISTPIISYWYTAMIGDGRNPPTILAASNFSGIALIGTHDDPRSLVYAYHACRCRSLP